MTRTAHERSTTATGAAPEAPPEPLAAEPTQLTMHSPVDGRALHTVPTTTAGQLTESVAAASAAFPSWASTPATERAVALHIAAERVRARAEELALLATLETGRPTSEALADVLAGAAALTRYAELGPRHGLPGYPGRGDETDLAVAEPRGLVAALTPWHDPVAITCELLGAALATGNVVLHKPSELAPLLGLELTDLVATGLPGGVLIAVTGGASVGQRLAADHRVNLIAHVGSAAAGRALTRLGADTGATVLTTHGGTSALLVDADVDPDWAAAQTALGCFTNAGQQLDAIERIYVHQDIAGAFLAALAEQAQRRVVEPAEPAQFELGPLITPEHRAHVHDQVTEAVTTGAEPLAGATIPPDPGAYYPATVLAGCTPDMRVLHEETFGPVAAVRAVPDFATGLVDIAASGRALAATVLTNSMRHAQRAWRALPADTVRVNDIAGPAGVGIGRELLTAMTQQKAVHWTAPPLSE